MTIRVVLDKNVCQGHGQCVIHSPSTFQIDDDTGLALLMEELHDASQLPELTDAMKSCPVGAIKIFQE